MLIYADLPSIVLCRPEKGSVGLSMKFEVVRSPCTESPECIVARALAILSTSCSKTKKSTKNKLTWMLKTSDLLQKAFDCHCTFTEVFHVNFSFLQVNEVQCRSANPHSSHSIHAFHFLKHARLCQFLVQNRNSVVLLKPLFDHARLAKQLR